MNYLLTPEFYAALPELIGDIDDKHKQPKLPVREK